MNTAKELPLFTYGSLMEGIYNYNLYLDGKITDKPLKARVKGKLFQLTEKTYPALIEGNDYVYGEIFYLKDFKKDLLAVDEMENFNPGHPEKDEYHRQVLTVEVFNEKTQSYEDTLDAYVYWYAKENDPTFEEHSLYIPDGNWRRYYEEHFA